MRVFVYEYTCAGLAGGEALASLRAEGAAMLCAVMEDFGRVLGVSPFTLLAGDCEFGWPDDRFRRLRGEAEEPVFRELAAEADATLVIAPECDGILLDRCRWVEEAGGRLLGPSPDAVRLTGDKRILARRLRRRGVPTPECRVIRPGKAPPTCPFPAVLKPRYGAGSLAAFLVRSPDEVEAKLKEARAEVGEGEWLLQPLVPGQPASVAFLVGPVGRLALAPAAQHLSRDGRFHYEGGSVPLPPDLGCRGVRLAHQAVRAVDGLRGYVGVDLVLGEAEDGSGDSVIEINPRLTTSYVGLRVLALTNLAQAMLDVAAGRDVLALTWKPGRVDFRADGMATWVPEQGD